MRRRGWTMLAAVVTLALFLVGAWGMVGIAEEVFIYARPVSKTIDPAPSCGDEEVQNAYMVYDQLATLDEDLNVIPSLAVSWETSADYTEYTFHLRKGVTFHDGTPFTADAVKFSFDRLLASGLQCIGTYSSLADENTVEILDDYTVKFHFTAPAPFIISEDFFDGVYSILNPNYVRAHATEDDPLALNWMTTHANGTGPFVLEEWIPGERMVFTKNVNYWNPDRMPAVDKVIFRIFTESSTARLWLETGEVHAAEKLTPDDFEALKGTPGVAVNIVPYPLMVYLMMDVSKPPFDDILVRKAMAYAINYKEIMEQVERGNAIRAHGLHPDSIVGYNEHPLPYRYDVELAKQLMALSNHQAGFTCDLNYTPERRASFEQEVVFLQAYLREIGINAQPVKTSLAAMNEKQTRGDYGITLKKWSSGLPTPDEMGGWLYDQARDDVTGWVATFWYDDWASNNMARGRSEADPVAREQLYKTTDAYFNELAIYVPMYQAAKLIAVRDDVKNFVFTPFLFGRFYSADLK